MCKAMNDFLRTRACALVLMMVSPAIFHGQTPATNDAQPADKNQAANQIVEVNDYIIGPDDILNISILDVPELTGEFRVSNTGKVTIPVLSHPVNAAGLSLAEFSQQLGRELKSSGLVTDPHINTSVAQSRTHSVSITGAVKHPQVYPLFTRTSLHDVLSQAEGLSDDAGSVAIVQRGEIGMRALAADNGKTLTAEQIDAGQTVTVDLTKLLEAGDSKLNIPVFPGDRVTVPHAGVVYVVGAVVKPGGFTMRPGGQGISVLQALALAGDTKITAIKNQTVIIRKDPEAPDGHKQIPVELKKVLGGKVPDPVMQAEDILFIPDSTGKRVLTRSLEAVLQTTAGIAVYRGR